MFYSLLKAYARLAIKIYCRRIIVNKPEMLKSKGPLLLAANHPNSFLDGMILTTLFEQPVYSLARGDAFKNRRMERLLRSLRLLPVYRSSEGSENLGHNYTTFSFCQETFEKGGIVLIFSEGKCVNEWHLRSLKKGTARLALTSWNKGTPLTVVPTAFNYSSFFRYGKEVHLLFGEPIQKEIVLGERNEGRQLLSFNEQLNMQLKQLVYELKPTDQAEIKRIFSIKKDQNFYLLLLPAIIGFILHLPLFLLCKLIARSFLHSGHYDSVLNASLLMLYPFYLLVLVLVAFSFSVLPGVLAIPLIPFTAWACTQVKYQLNR